MSTASHDLRAHIPALDGLRGTALLLVLLYHANALGMGWIGVQLFFVLSGFLITRVLLDLRESRPKRGPVKTFYARRVLRIFPAYYAYLAIVLLAVFVVWPQGEAAEHARQQWWAAASYTHNWYRVWNPAEKTLVFDHLWSLAIEEQFYVLWPALILLVPRRLHLPIVLGVLCAGPLLRWGLAQQIDPLARAAVVGWATTSHLDAFAAGAAVQLVLLGRWRHGQAPRLWLIAAAGFAVLACALGLLANQQSLLASVQPQQTFGAWFTLGWPNGLPAGRQSTWATQWVWGYSLINLSVAAAIACVVTRPRTALLEAPWLRWVGRVSYSGYVLHFAVAHLMQPLVYQIHFATDWGFYACIAAWLPCYLATVLLLAWLSYRWVEQPMLSMKSRWPRGPQTATLAP